MRAIPCMILDSGDPVNHFHFRIIILKYTRYIIIVPGPVRLLYCICTV